MKSNHVFQNARASVELNFIQQNLLNQTKGEGLTPTHLTNWQPYTGIEQASFNLAAADIEPFPSFSRAHSDAVLFLMRQQGLQPLEAIGQINGITEAEAALLRQYFPQGFNRSFIVDNRANYNFASPLFQPTLSFLLDRKKIPLLAALLELRDLTTNEMVVLQDLYRYGLRGDQLRAAHLGDIAQFYVSSRNNPAKADSTSRDAANYFIKVFRCAIKHNKPAIVALQEAASELTLIKANVQAHPEGDVRKGVSAQSSKRINFLSFYAYSGVRAKDCPVIMSKEYWKTLSVLRFVYCLDVQVAVAQLKGLSEDKVVFMRKYFTHGANNSRLRDFPHNMVFPRFFMMKLRWSPEQAIEALTSLTSNQLIYFYYLLSYGMNLQMAQSLQPDAAYSEVRRDVAIFLINERQASPEQALHDVTTRTEDELIAMMQSQERVIVPLLR